MTLFITYYNGVLLVCCIWELDLGDVIACAAWMVSDGSAFGLMDKIHKLYIIHESCHCADGVLAREDGSLGGNVRTDVL